MTPIVVPGATATAPTPMLTTIAVASSPISTGSAAKAAADLCRRPFPAVRAPAGANDGELNPTPGI